MSYDVHKQHSFPSTCWLSNAATNDGNKRKALTTQQVVTMARMERGRGVHKVLVGKPEGKRPLRRPRRRWEDNIKMDLEEVGRGCGDWMELAKDRNVWRALVSTVMNFRVVP